MLTRKLLFVAIFFSGAHIAWSQDDHSLEKDAGSHAEKFYEESVKPLLQNRCYACHGALKQQADLRLDTGSLILKGGDSGPALTPNKPDESLLIERITEEDSDLRMPPEHEGEKLEEAQVEILRKWILQGAVSPSQEIPEEDPRDHWAFQPVVRTEPPVPKNEAWRTNPIDRWIALGHEQHQLRAQPPAPASLTVRRLYLDLLGVPPTPEEIAEFTSDPTPERYAQLVDQLLDDPRYGERWGRHWMDIWRYSDWWGLGQQHRNSHPLVWHWRDWIIESLNDDLPYDEMIRQMLAADELYPEDLDRLRATGFLVRNWFLFNRDQWLEETVEHVSKGLLGLTMNCSKCHDHKYDPIEQADFYRMRAFFEPYHVRVDMIPAEVDLAKNGIARVFDATATEPTYLYIRGDQKQPDTSRVISPGFPSILGEPNPEIQPISLPRSTTEPGRRPWVIDNHLEAVAQRQAEATESLRNLEKRLTDAQQLRDKLQREGPHTSDKNDMISSPLVSDDFQAPRPKLWKLFGGMWEFGDDHLHQKMDGPTRSAARLLEKVPTDFDAVFEFEIVGGSRWRSVGLSFDTVTEDPTIDPAGNESEVHVYLSAFAGGSKLQASYHQGNAWAYPTGNGVKAMPVELNRVYQMRVQVRGTLLNASLDGEPILAWRIPIARRPGSIQLTTFDALAKLHHFELRELSSESVLQTPSGEPPAAPRTVKEAEEAVAALDLEVAAQRALTKVIDSEITVLRSLKQTIGTDSNAASHERDPSGYIAAQKNEKLMRAQHTVAQARLELHRAKTEETEARQKALEKATEELATAETQTPSSNEAVHWKFPTGAQWTPTRFLNSGKDDPAIEFPTESTGRRTALARWITDPSNPLTARVAINHLWSRHFGQPLVATEFDFGRNGSPPSHPELLDWLSAELMDQQWSMKHIHRLICTSETYRMSSSTLGGDENLKLDPENNYFWRRPTLRLESQVIRDSLLSVAGVLDLTQGGPPVQQKDQDASKRRSIYFFHSNNDRNLFLTQFDEAPVKECYRRDQSIVPQQALALTNSSLVLDLAPQIAETLSNVGAEESDFIRVAFEVLLGSTPTEREIEASHASLKKWRELPGGSDASARSNLIWALVNHNDYVTLR